MIDATHLETHRTAASPLKGGALPRRIGRTKGGLNSKLHAVCDGEGRPIMLLLTEGQMNDHKGAFLLLSALPNARELLLYQWLRQQVVPGSPDRAAQPAKFKAT